VFEIGNSLREARLRQGYELPRVEADTKIRAKYLRALEEERFEVLPGETYVKGFLRTYAEYLGLDGQLYVDEFNSRFTREEEPLAPPRPRRQLSRSRAVESNFVIVALAGIIAVTILVVVAWKFGSSGAQPSTGIPPVVNTPTESTGTDKGQAPAAPRPKKAKKVRLVLYAEGGDCWLQVRSKSATGKLLYEGTLQAGQTQRFVDEKRIWLQLGAPTYLKGTVNGDRIRNMPNGPAIAVVKTDGLQLVSIA
jgi:Helix-turn-helix domain/RodZ C-terminal domain